MCLCGSSDDNLLDHGMYAASCDGIFANFRLPTLGRDERQGHQCKLSKSDAFSPKKFFTYTKTQILYSRKFQ